MVKSIGNSEMRKILRRQELINRHQPKCPSCASEQVQIMSKQIPAKWRCRRCKQFFTSEPEGELK